MSQEITWPVIKKHIYTVHFLVSKVPPMDVCTTKRWAALRQVNISLMNDFSVNYIPESAPFALKNLLKDTAKIPRWGSKIRMDWGTAYSSSTWSLSTQETKTRETLESRGVVGLADFHSGMSIVVKGKNAKFYMLILKA